MEKIENPFKSSWENIGFLSKISEKMMFSDSVSNIVNFVKRLPKKSQITINCQRKNIANLVKMFQK